METKTVTYVASSTMHLNANQEKLSLKYDISVDVESILNIYMAY
jgi:hypothetical protein